MGEEKVCERGRMGGARGALLEAGPRLSGRTRERPSVRLQVIKGRGQIYRTIREFVAEAKEEVLAFTTTKGLQRSYRAGINEALLDSMRRGVKPRLVADIQDRKSVV